MKPLFPIAYEYLPCGEIAHSGIYSQDMPPVLLIGNGTTLTYAILEKLKMHLKRSRNVYVEGDYHKQLLANGVPTRLRQEFIEKSVGYTTAKTQVRDLLTDLVLNKEISCETVESASFDLCEKIEIVDSSLLLQCVNGRNAVDEYLISHSTNVAILNGMIGKWLELDPTDMHLLIQGGLLHDVGKTEVPQNILNAPRKLTEEEFELVKKHAMYSYELVCKNEKIDPAVALIARHHHEKMPGTGYPDGLKGDEIPLFARITAISDIYDAMVSSRCYKDGLNPFLVLEHIANGKFNDLDFQLIELFLKKMSVEMVGKSVLLSDGCIGVVKFIDQKRWQYPMVQVDEQVVHTDENRNCVSVIM